MNAADPLAYETVRISRLFLYGMRRVPQDFIEI